ncbi:MAG: proteasome-type protease [Methyloversatilis discipulorum]|uniref:proteasome-type protease n=1 Tax=Methyloversatilis discipulorum TaxID=1119528 RepID=UPI0026F3622C|nr:proteasome-type protease [Methyloversatilis discipulorum]MBV5286854.1 proteasome-type protease [Methyloversatilis discipulorum]
MTYCVGMLLDAGLVCLSDSRTNAGVDHINTFRKMNLFERQGERVLVLMSAGNLALTQTLVSLLRERLATDGPNLYTVTNMFEAARHVGDCLREVHARDGEALKEFGIEFNASLILGGQILGEEPRLFQIYAAGNFIEATRDTPYFQIGEAKYGKPIIDRVIRPETTLDEAAKCALISMDSTIRSNLSVGLPLDLLVLRTGALKVCSHTRIDAENAYFEMIRTRWGESLREAFHALPSPDWIPPA